MSAMSYNNSVYTPTMFRQPTTTSFSPPSLHTSTNNASNNGSPYSLHLYPPLSDHQQSSQHPSMTTQSTTTHQWPSSPDKQRLNHYQSPGSNTITVNMSPFGSNFSSNGSLHMLDDKSKTPRSMMDTLPPSTISTSISTFPGPPPQHMIPQHPSSGVSLPPPSNQSLSVHTGGMDNMSPMGRNPSRALTNSKRAAQNRAAQRAFRQRKDKYIKDLEAKAKDLDNTKKQLDNLLREKAEMSQTIKNLKTEIAKLKGEEISEDEGRQVFGNNNNLNGGNNNNNNGNSSNSNYSHYGNSTRNDDDPQGLGDEPWLRHNKDLSRKDCNSNNSFNSNDERSNNFPFSPSSSSSSVSSSSSSGLNRSNTINESSSSRGGSGLVLPPGPNTDSSVEPYFRPDYRNVASHHTSPTSTSSSSSSERRSSSYPNNNNNNNNNNQVLNINHNGRYPNNEEDTDRVYDDLCELLKTRTRPALPQNIGNLWQQSHHSSSQQVSNGSSTVVG